MVMKLEIRGKEAERKAVIGGDCGLRDDQVCSAPTVAGLKQLIYIASRGSVSRIHLGKEGTECIVRYFEYTIFRCNIFYGSCNQLKYNHVFIHTGRQSVIHTEIRYIILHNYIHAHIILHYFMHIYIHTYIQTCCTHTITNT
jgi:hypothetical protein